VKTVVRTDRVQRLYNSEMNFISIMLLALAMSTDAFAVAVGKGAALHEPRWSEALRTGVIFGVIESLTPILGWAVGFAAAQYVTAWDHWIAFLLLGGLGGQMVIANLDAPNESEIEKPNKHSFWLLAITGFATSIDALIVGIGLAFLDIDILPIAAAIGFTTFVMVTMGVMLGQVLGVVTGKRAGTVAGLLLIGIGTAILIEHLTAQ
jgi:putative Mn2+ efflux pump MntP